MDFTEFDLQRIRSIISYKGVTFCALPVLDANVWGYYNKLVAFILIAKDV
ncbi:hypothetical protein AOH283_14150 [Helicobacter pylori]